MVQCILAAASVRQSWVQSDVTIPNVNCERLQAMAAEVMCSPNRSMNSNVGEAEGKGSVFFSKFSRVRQASRPALGADVVWYTPSRRQVLGAAEHSGPANSTRGGETRREGHWLTTGMRAYK